MKKSIGFELLSTVVTVKVLKKANYVVATSSDGWNQLPTFSGTLSECQKYMSNNPALGYGTDNTGIYPEKDWVVDYL